MLLRHLSPRWPAELQPARFLTAHAAGLADTAFLIFCRHPGLGADLHIAGCGIGVSVDGRTIVVNLARPREEGRSGGGYNDGGYRSSKRSDVGYGSGGFGGGRY